MPQTIQFGIPSFDQLLGFKETAGRKKYGIHLEKEDESISICIVGADGTGKSVLAMHLAATYLTNYNAKVLYATTDLSYNRAATNWKSFALFRPAWRIHDPFQPAS